MAAGRKERSKERGRERRVKTDGKERTEGGKVRRKGERGTEGKKKVRKEKRRKTAKERIGMEERKRRGKNKQAKESRAAFSSEKPIADAVDFPDSIFPSDNPCVAICYLFIYLFTVCTIKFRRDAQKNLANEHKNLQFTQCS